MTTPDRAAGWPGSVPRSAASRLPWSGGGILIDAPRAGPLIVEEYDATCIVLPGYSARVDSNANIDIRVDA